MDNDEILSKVMALQADLDDTQRKINSLCSAARFNGDDRLLASILSYGTHGYYQGASGPRTESISARARSEPVKEITREGRKGLFSHRCMLCGSDTESAGTNSLDEDLFQCLSCQAEFKETELGPKLLPSSFEEHAEYSITLNSGEQLVFIFSLMGFPVSIISSNKGGTTVRTYKDGESEFFIVPEGIGGHGERVYPYCRKESNAIK